MKEKLKQLLCEGYIRCLGWGALYTTKWSPGALVSLGDRSLWSLVTLMVGPSGNGHGEGPQRSSRQEDKDIEA
jgi:hypothetical protein